MNDTRTGLLAIGAFASAAQLSIKALRLYDQLGILRPSYVDQYSGYRYYHASQLRPAPFTPEQTEAWIARQIASYATHGYGRWAAIDRASGAQLGDVGLMQAQVNGRDEIDLGYIIHHPYWRQGYALEAARACLEFARAQPGITRVVANMPHDHHGSRRVAEKLGLAFEGEFANARNRGIRTLLYALEIVRSA